LCCLLLYLLNDKEKLDFFGSKLGNSGTIIL
jgi:hypothetical protein